MIDINYIRENPLKVKLNNKSRNRDIDIDKLLELDGKRRQTQTEFDALRSAQKKFSKEKPSEEQSLKLREMKNRVKDLEKSLAEIEKEIFEIMIKIPNLNLDSTPVGGEEDNVFVREVGKKQEFLFHPKKHEEIGENLGLFDIERGAKVAGNRFWFLQGKAVLLQFALVNYVLDILVKKGFYPILPPHLVRENTLFGAGFLPANEFEIYKVNPGEDDLYLIGTSEATIVAYHQDEIIDVKSPKRYFGYSPCYRREAGAYGKDTTGILRGHQFDKIEMVSFTNSKDSEIEHEFLLSVEEEIIKGLDLHYRIMNLASGDCSTHAAKCYDIEAWLPGQGKYREVTSCSNVLDYQSRRLNIRYKNQNKLEFVHTLNGTGLAMGRAILAILENYQNENGTVSVPKVLRKYLSFEEIS